MSEVIRCEGLDFSYGARPVLRGVDLSISRGEVVCLLGPNGAGKTTLVELLLGSLRPSSGGVRVLGCDPRGAGHAFWSRVGLVQQNWSDHPRWRVRDQLEWIRSTHQTVVDEVLEVGRALAAVGLEGRASSRLGDLSGGQRRAVDLAAALLARPELLILDEPTTGLDPAAKARMHDLILDQVDQVGATVLMTTHDLAEAERIASRILILAGGGIVANGTATQLRESLPGRAEVTWVHNGEHHVHATDSPEKFVSALDLEHVSSLSVSRPTLEEAYLALTAGRGGVEGPRAAKEQEEYQS
ncbi:ABC transporter ATP-binding protein [Actinomyces bowdenii]|uniref:ABC transporter ATP-binding protein n=1 Tax=Actinomyces bowdenii TaxID=131109 RepID=A0A853EK61_9ACTO|nr:ABC transporter ATP-binding protein [Actinomyces bowdenii]MBF0696747.1 ABC transporter ATP-binding protein [Actinomyces bowdenii]NYS68920.1 ABC transporter ATP-binding protein [Actinomyces bowdenii]